MLEAGRQSVNEALKAGEITPHVRRQLVKDRAKSGAELAHAVKEHGDALRLDVQTL
jgi:hypothetical protein